MHCEKLYKDQFQLIVTFVWIGFIPIIMLSDSIY
jgi:hypothetical protein